MANAPAGEARADLDGGSVPARMVARARLMMVLSAVTTLIAIAAVIAVIGYRVFRAGESGSGPAAEGVVTLPKGARVVAIAAASGRLVLTIESSGASELRVYDLKTLKETGRLRFATEP